MSTPRTKRLLKQRRLLTTAEAAEHLGITAEALARAHREGDGPRYIQLGKAGTRPSSWITGAPYSDNPRYLVEDLNAWHNQNKEK